MNKEVTKAMNKTTTKSQRVLGSIRRWWGNNGYKIMRIIFFPIWGVVCFNNYLDNKIEWNEARTAEILNYYIPRIAHWDKEEKEFSFFDNGCGWSISFAKKYLKLKDRRYWNKFQGFCGGEIRNYLINKFELEGFTKELGDCSWGWTEIFFKLNEKNT